MDILFRLSQTLQRRDRCRMKLVHRLDSTFFSTLMDSPASRLTRRLSRRILRDVGLALAYKKLCQRWSSLRARPHP